MVLAHKRIVLNASTYFNLVLDNVFVNTHTFLVQKHNGESLYIITKKNCLATSRKKYANVERIRNPKIFKFILNLHSA